MVILYESYYNQCVVFLVSRDDFQSFCLNFWASSLKLILFMTKLTQTASF